MLHNPIRSDKQVPIRKEIKEPQLTFYFSKQIDIVEHNHHLWLNASAKDWANYKLKFAHISNKDSIYLCFPKIIFYTYCLEMNNDYLTLFTSTVEYKRFSNNNKNYQKKYNNP